MSRDVIRRYYLIAMLALGSGWLCAARAAAPDANCQQCQPQPGCACPWCPNDYCRKTLPVIPRTPCQWLCDLYCRKPLPSIPPTPCQWQPNDYCPKPPVPIRSNCQPSFRCVPTQPNAP